jgi:hypothetical protein
VIEKIHITGFEKRPVVIRDANGKAFENEFKNGVCIVHRVHMPVKENWVIGFEFEGVVPPDLEQEMGQKVIESDDDDGDVEGEEIGNEDTESRESGKPGEAGKEESTPMYHEDEFVL